MQPCDGCDGILLAVGIGQQFRQSRHIVRIAQGAQGPDCRPADLALGRAQQLEHGGPGGRIASLGQGAEQTHLGLGDQFGQKGRETPRCLRSLHVVADLPQADGADVLVLVGNKIAHRIDEIVVGKGGCDLRSEY